MEEIKNEENKNNKNDDVVFIDIKDLFSGNGVQVVPVDKLEKKDEK